MPKLTNEIRASLKAANPEALVLRTPELKDSDFVFRATKVTEFDAFLAALNGNDESAKVYAHRQFARDLLVFPSLEEWDALSEARPGICHTFGVELSNRAGLGAEVQVDAL